MAKVRRVMLPRVPESKGLRVAAYARVSSGKDAMLHSLSAQVSYFSDYIQKHPGWVFAGIYADEAKTGTRDDRPEFQRMLQDCRDGRIDMIVTKAISRFARNTVTLLETTRELKALGVTVFFQKEGLYSNHGQGELVLSLLATVAQEESRAVSDNCKWRIRNRFKAGKLVNLNFMYGYRIKKGQIEIQPAEAAIVASMFDAYLSGTGTKAIAHDLAENQVPTPRGGQWTANRVLRILKNEKYAGNALLQKKYVVDHISKKLVLNHGQKARYFGVGTHPAIVNPDVFQRVQQMIEGNRIRDNIKGRTTQKYPFTGKIKCEHCGKSYRRIMRQGIAKWQCATYLDQGSAVCPAKQIPEDTLLALAARTLGLNAFDADIFNARILKIQVTKPNTVRFIFRDGQEIDAPWQDRSRSDSWTDDMRSRAREHALLKGIPQCK